MSERALFDNQTDVEEDGIGGGIPGYLGDASEIINLSREADTNIENAESNKMASEKVAAFSSSFHIGQLLNNSMNLRNSHAYKQDPSNVKDLFYGKQ